MTECCDKVINSYICYNWVLEPAKTYSLNNQYTKPISTWQEMLEYITSLYNLILVVLQLEKVNSSQR